MTVPSFYPWQASNPCQKLNITEEIINIYVHRNDEAIIDRIIIDRAATLSLVYQTKSWTDAYAGIVEQTVQRQPQHCSVQTTDVTDTANSFN